MSLLTTCHGDNTDTLRKSCSVFQLLSPSFKSTVLYSVPVLGQGLCETRLSSVTGFLVVCCQDGALRRDQKLGEKEQIPGPSCSPEDPAFSPEKKATLRVM